MRLVKLLLALLLLVAFTSAGCRKGAKASATGGAGAVKGKAGFDEAVDAPPEPADPVPTELLGYEGDKKEEPKGPDGAKEKEPPAPPQPE